MICDECREQLEFKTVLVDGYDIEVTICKTCDKIIDVEY